MTSHHCPERIAEDYELSERLGRELEEAGYEALPPAPVPERKVRFMVQERRFSARGGEIKTWTEWVELEETK